MAVRYLKPGEGFSFPSDFGFTQSSSGNVESRNHPDMDPTDGGTYVHGVARAHGGPIHKAAGGDIQQETPAPQHVSFGQAFRQARSAMTNGGPKTFMWQGRSYSTDLAGPQQASDQSTGRARPGASESTGRAHSASQSDMPMPPIPPDYVVPSSRAAGDFSNYNWDREQTLQANAELNRARGAPPSAVPPGRAQPAQRPAYDGRYALTTPEEERNAYVDLQRPPDDGQAHARGGPIRRAVGGPIIPGRPGAPQMGAMPAGVPGPAQGGQGGQGGGPLSHATITMPVNDAARAVAGAVRLGHGLGQRQAMQGGGMPQVPGQMMTQGQGMPPGAAAPAMAEGGHFIQGAIKHPGALHRDLGVPQGQPIPAGKLERATHSQDSTVRRRAVLAETMKGFHHGKK